MKQTFNLPIFIINLDHCKGRYDEVKAQLSKLGLTCERIPAIQGSLLSKTEIDNVYCHDLNKKNAHRNLTAGEIGCYISHRNIWKKMIKDEIEMAVVLEDDIFIDSNIFALEQAKQSFSAYDVIKLADNRNGPSASSIKLGTGHQLISYNTIPNCTTGYAITLAGAKKFLAREKFYRPVDIDIQHCYELNASVVGLTPYPVTENKKWESEIAKNNGGKHSNKSTLLRNIKYRIKLAYYRKFYISSQI